MVDHKPKNTDPINWTDTLGTLLVALIGFIAFPIMMSDAIKTIRFTFASQTTKAIVTNVEKLNDFKRGNVTISKFDVTYEFTAQNGRAFRGRQALDYPAPSTIREGDQIDIFHVKSMPSQSLVGHQQSATRGIFSILLVAGLGAGLIFLLWAAVSAITEIWRWIGTRHVAQAASNAPASNAPETSRRTPWYLWPGRAWWWTSDLFLRSFREIPRSNRAVVLTLFSGITMLIGGVSIWAAGPMATSVQLMLFSDKTNGIILKSEAIETKIRRSMGYNIDTIYSFSLPDGRQFTGQALRTGFTRLRQDEVGHTIDVYYMRYNPRISGLYDQFEPDFIVLVYFGPIYVFLMTFLVAFWHGFWRFLRT